MKTLPTPNSAGLFWQNKEVTKQMNIIFQYYIQCMAIGIAGSFKSTGSCKSSVTLHNIISPQITLIPNLQLQAQRWECFVMISSVLS